MLKTDIIKEMGSFSLNNYVANLFWSVSGFALPVMVVNLLGTEQNAYFYISWAIASVLLVIPTAISTSLLAEGSSDRPHLSQQTARSYKLFLITIIPTVLLAYLLGDKILLVFGQEYSDNATRLLQILAISALPYGINLIYFNVKKVQLKMKGVIWLSLVVAAVTLMLSYFLIQQIGLEGVGLAWLSGNSVVALWIVVRSFFIRGKNDPPPPVESV
jgi:O-antigen/teichoic acid export membrane protein